MKNLILWSVMFVAYFTYTFPPLVCSESRAAKMTRALLSAVIGATMGYGLGEALVAIW